MTRDLDLLFEIGSLRNVPRSWKQHLRVDCASVLEHTVRVMLLSLVIARAENDVDENKVIRMALVHDLPESRVSDLSWIQQVYTKADEERAAKDMFGETSLADFMELFKEYEKKECKEAQIVKDADHLDVDLELKEVANLGVKVGEKWSHIRQEIRNKKFYTKTAQKIWDDIQRSDPDRWYVGKNTVFED